MALRLGFDIDGVLADFKNAFRNTARRVLRDGPGHGGPGSNDEKLTISPKDVDRVWAHIAQTQNWWMGVGAHEPDQIARLYALARSSRWEVFFLTKRPVSGGDPVQFQTQWWLEQQGYFLPSVLTVPGSRGELANSLRLDVVVDDQLINCAEIIGASPTKTLLMLREPDQKLEQHATNRGIGVVTNLTQAIDAILRLEEILPTRVGKPVRLVDWFLKKNEEGLPLNPRAERPLPGPAAE